jgi:RNA recognition motif-containing protein
LDYKVDEKKLKEVFKLAGKVVSAELSLDKEGKSRGFGVVEYEHPVEAVQAICILSIVLGLLYIQIGPNNIICCSFLWKPNQTLVTY